MGWVYHGCPNPGSVQGQMRWGFGAALAGNVPWGLELTAFKVHSDPTHPTILDAEGREKLTCFHGVLVLHGKYEIPGGMFMHRGGWGVFWKHHHSGCKPFTGLAWNGSCALFTFTSSLLSLLCWDAELLCPHLHVWLLCPSQPGTVDAPAPVVEAIPDHPAAGN